MHRWCPDIKKNYAQRLANQAQLLSVFEGVQQNFATKERQWTEAVRHSIIDHKGSRKQRQIMDSENTDGAFPSEKLHCSPQHKRAQVLNPMASVPVHKLQWIGLDLYG